MPLGQLSFYPLNESGHARGLHCKRERYENERCPALVEVIHKILSTAFSPENQANATVWPGGDR